MQVGVAATASRDAVIRDFVTSREFYDTLVNGWFTAYLGRPADPGGGDYYGQLMQNGLTREQIETALVASAEYWQRTR